MKLVSSLVVAILALALSACGAFSPSGGKTSSAGRHLWQLKMSDTAAAAPTSTEGEQSYVKCSRCQTAYGVSDEDLGNGKGRYVMILCIHLLLLCRVYCVCACLLTILHLHFIYNYKVV